MKNREGKGKRNGKSKEMGGKGRMRESKGRERNRRVKDEWKGKYKGKRRKIKTGKRVKRK